MFENMTKEASNTMLAMMKEYSKMMEKGIDPQGFTDALQSTFKAPEAPKVSFNKNGYEIRTKVLEMAQGNVWNDYHAKFAGWEQTVKRDKETGEIITEVKLPEVPGADAVLEAAEKFYAFVNGR
jgi:hypothetical protein